MSESIVVLDACVLYPAPVRDILLSLSAMGLFQPKWTDAINEEWVSNLLYNRRDLKRTQLALTVASMNKAFQYARITEYEDLIPSLTLPDKDDRHVLASAIKSEATGIITFNLKDFPDHILQKYAVVAINPDDFISSLFKEHEEVVCEGVRRMVMRLRNPPKTIEDVSQTLEKCGLAKTARKIKGCC